MKNRRLNTNCITGNALMVSAWLCADILYRGGWTRDAADRWAAAEFKFPVSRLREWRKGHDDKSNRRSLELALERSTVYRHARRGLGSK